MIGFILLACTARAAEVLVWVGAPTPAQWTSFESACASESRNGEPLLGAPLACNSTFRIADVLINNTVFTPDEHAGSGNALVATGGKMLSSFGGETVLDRLIARPDGNTTDGPVWLGCGPYGFNCGGSNCDDFSGSSTGNSRVGNTNTTMSITWYYDDLRSCTDSAIPVYCFLVLPTASPTSSPTTHAPTTSPTTSAPTASPTTAFPTTASPTTVAPTTTSPTTVAPTTAAPTRSPNTLSPTTAAPSGSPSGTPSEPPAVNGETSLTALPAAMAVCMGLAIFGLF